MEIKKELKFFIRCFVAEAFVDELELPEVVWLGVRTGKFTHIYVNKRAYKIRSIEPHNENILNVQLLIFSN